MNPCCSAVRFTMEVPKNIHRRRRFRDLGIRSSIDRVSRFACGYDVRENAGKKKGERKGRKNWEKKRFESKIRKEKTRDKIRKTLIRYQQTMEPFSWRIKYLVQISSFSRTTPLSSVTKECGGGGFNSIQFNSIQWQRSAGAHLSSSKYYYCCRCSFARLPHGQCRRG